MSESPTSHPRPHRARIKKLLAAKGSSEPVENIGDFLNAIRKTSERWREEDWQNVEGDEDYLLNDVRIVGQVWFRGQRNCDHGLVPGLYRENRPKTCASTPEAISLPRMKRATDSTSCLTWNTNCLDRESESDTQNLSGRSA